MRPLSAFGDLLKRDPGCDNDFRGDLLEGTSHSYSHRKQSAFFNDIVDESSNNLEGMGQISEYYLQMRIFSLYCLEYNQEEGAFFEPSKKLMKFGDTAVIIVDPIRLLRQFADALLREYNDTFWFAAKRVEYVINLTELNEYDEFSKQTSYSWQNEFRIALDLSEGQADEQAWENMSDFCRIMFLNQGGKVDLAAKREPVIVQIGDIREACISIPTRDLVCQNLPFDRLNQILVPPPFYPPRRPVVTAYRPIIIASK